MSQYEITFMDGQKRIVTERTFSRAKVRAAWERLINGAEGHKELTAVSGDVIGRIAQNAAKDAVPKTTAQPSEGDCTA